MTQFVYWPGHAWVALPIRWYLAFVFLVACVHKIVHPEMFALDVATYDILPLFLVNSMAIVLPWIELVAGILLILGWRTRAASMLIFLMMLMFTVAILLALHKGLDMSCGCFASQAATEDDPISWKTVLRDVGWLLFAAYVMIFDHKPLGMDRLLARKVKPHA